jgi:hypothetical protein
VPYDAIRIVLTYLNTRTDLAESLSRGAEYAD